MKVVFLDLRRVVAESRDATDSAIARVLESGRFVLGEPVEAFERSFAAASRAREAVGVGSGTDALEVALRAVGVRPGDEVVTQANTCAPTVAAIARAGGIPVLCDVDLDTGRMDVSSLVAAVSERTRAVVPVHLYGQCVDIAELRRAVAGAGVAFVEDCAQAHLAEFDGQPAGTMGVAGCFSFYPTKNLGAIGDAGAIVTDDPALAELARAIRQYAAFGSAAAASFGLNSRLDTIQAAVLEARLGFLAAWTDRRRAIASTYRRELDGVGVEPLGVDPRADHVHHLFVVRSSDRDRLRARLVERGIQTLVHYDTPIHELPAYAGNVRTPTTLHNAERLCREVLSLPLYPQMTDEDILAVVEGVRRAAY